METHSPSIYTQNNQDPDLGVTSTDGSHANDASDNFLQHGSHNVHYIQDTDDEDDKRSYDSRSVDPNRGQRAPTDPLDETPRSLSPFDHGLNILSQTIDATGETTESFFQGQMAHEAENEGLSISIPLASDYRGSINSASQAPYWDERNAYIKGFMKKLQTFENLEYSVNDAGQEEVSRQEGPPTHDESRNSMQTKWLHLQSATMDLDVLQQFVMECHLIGDDVKTVTIELVERAGKKYRRHSETGSYIEPGSVLRGIGNYSQQNSLSSKTRPTVPVVFVASPYLRLRPLKGHQDGGNRGDHHPQTLLQNLYGFDVTPNRDKTQIIRKIGNGSQLDNALHVNQIWCLLIGPTLLITMSDHTTEELLDGTIGKRSLGYEPPIKIKIIDDKQKHHDIAVSSSITWVDLFKITMDAVQNKRSDFPKYDLLDENKVIITAERWIEIASSRNLRKSPFYTIYLTLRPNSANPSKDRLFLEYSRYDASSILNEMPTKDRRSDAFSGLVGSSKKESSKHESADQLTSNTASAPLFLYQDGTGFIVSSPDPQDPDELYDTGTDPLGIIPQSHRSESVEGANTTMPLGINNSPNDREAPEASSTGNFTSLIDDIAGNITDIDGTIGLPETNKHNINHKKIRHKKMQPGAEISVETYSSVQEDDPNASNDLFLKQLFIHKQRQSQSQGSIPSFASGANAESISSRRDSLRTYHTHQHTDSQYRLPSPIITNLNSEYPRKPSIVEDDKNWDRRHALKAKSTNSGSASHSHHRRRNTFIKQTPVASITSDLAGDKYTTTNVQGSRLGKIVPFFLWGPCIPTSSSSLRSAKEADMIKLLDEADEVISNSQVGKSYYVKVPKLTEEEFLSRQDIPNGGFQEDDISIVKESPTYRNVDQTAAENTVKDNTLPNTVSKVDHAGGNTHQEMEGVEKNNTGSEITLPAVVQDGVARKQAQSLGIFSPDKELMEQLVTVSRQILWSFLPKTGSSTVHPLLKRFWGCMDIIRRQLIWEESEREPHDVPTYIIRDFSANLQRTSRSQSPNSQKTLLAKCGDCKGGKHYSSAEEALNHFHDEHFDCHHRGERPYDDPCYSWLHRIWHSHYPVRNDRNSLLRNGQEFERELSELALHLNELHTMVTSKEDDSMGDLAIRPPLPKHIFYAFQKIVQVFVLRAKRLSLMTRIKASSGSDLSKISDKINELQVLEKTAKDRMLDLLDHAKRDIFLSGNTSSDIERPQPQAVGAEFLALAFICKSHNLPFEAKTSNPRRNNNTLKVYKRYASKLHYQANQRPQKRVFLDIRDLEEELDALNALLNHQKECLHRFAKSISPDTLRLTTMTRVAQNRVEKAYQDNHLRQLDIRIQEVQNMKTRSKFLKEQVKQTIEIMEEDHGKAIRVFTIVTLFFLPLSFVSSFMGMNTADVRNMHYKQGLFWATGIPVTLFVLTLACIYGYKGDEIRDWAMQLSLCSKDKKLQLPVDGETE
ncbi:corA-like mg2+ transporter protein domain-containing protein [Trichoderma breve]|uniref:CorA-like mg2+ transporter protein domain-containing protein n=1 Tax=Trichoderma breve TaxID=2034170 RepID=A0A9W9E4Z6_9HYPO|nr:corA-like mg2+ transporter protein domain-containing protein [Trichoderma breve]KAJ4854886.1 corA-like mg2+ transporter protein domain-containing protein [Trichoderma breve]